MQWHDIKYPSLCTHDFHKSLTNEVELPCNNNSNLTHRISQMGKICNKCTHIIRDSRNRNSHCLVCSQELEQYVKDRQLCQHDHPEFSDIIVKCLDDQKKTHEVPFSTKICKRCTDKLRAAFMNSKNCKVCEGKEEQVIRDMEKTIISSAFSHFKTVIATLAQGKASDQVFKNQIESACKSTPKIERIGTPLINAKLIEEYNAADSEENHQSKRYKLYPKCRKHRDVQINVCNNCLVALLNVDSCPFDCISEQKTQKVKVDKQVKIYQTGFLCLYPLPIDKTCCLELFVLKLIEERGRMDRWQSKIQRLNAKSQKQVLFQQNFPLYSSAVAIGNRQFLLCGGSIGPHISKMKQTNQAFVISLSADLKEYQITQIDPMNSARSGHSLVYHPGKKMVFAIGGFQSEGQFLKDVEVYNFADRKWYELNELTIQRSKACAFVYQDDLYVLGGLSTNSGYYDGMIEKFNFEEEVWESFAYNGFDFPFATSCTASTSLSNLTNKRNLFFVGGTNTQEATKLVQPIQIDGAKHNFVLNHLKTENKMRFGRFSPTLGLIKEDNLICFGGTEEYESFLNFQGFALKIDEKSQEVNIFSALDPIETGSYRLILRQDSKVTYKRLYDLLERQGLINGEKLSKHEDRTVAESQNNHLIERLWYTTGKQFVWVPM